MHTCRYWWLYLIAVAAGLVWIATQVSYGSTPPGTVIALKASVTYDGGSSEAERSVVVVSPAWVAAGRPTVFICPQQRWVEDESVVPPMVINWRLNTRLWRPKGKCVIQAIDPLANGWCVRTAAGCAGIQLTGGGLR